MPQSPFNTFVAKVFGNNGFAAMQLGKQGDLATSQLHGSRYQQAYQGNLFAGTNQAGDTLSAGLATTYVGICLSNPAGSLKNLVPRMISGLTDVAPAAEAAFGLIVGFAAGGITAHTTALTLQSATVGGSVAASVAKLDAACTLVGTPVWRGFLGVNGASTNNASFFTDLNGSLIIPPGGYMAIGSIAAGPASGFFGSIEWEEVAP